MIWNIAGCIPSFDDDPELRTAFSMIRQRLLDASQASGTPVIDAPAVIGQLGAPWNYIPGVSDDIHHFNTVGAELIVPLARDALHRSIFGDVPQKAQNGILLDPHTELKLNSSEDDSLGLLTR